MFMYRDDTMLREGSRTQRNTYYMIPLIWDVQIDKPIEAKSRGREEVGGTGVILWGTEMFWSKVVDMAAQHWISYKPLDCTLQLLWYGDFISTFRKMFDPIWTWPDPIWSLSSHATFPLALSVPPTFPDLYLCSSYLLESSFPQLASHQSDLCPNVLTPPLPRPSMNTPQPTTPSYRPWHYG